MAVHLPWHAFIACRHHRLALAHHHQGVLSRHTCWPASLSDGLLYGGRSLLSPEPCCLLPCAATAAHRRCSSFACHFQPRCVWPQQFLTLLSLEDDAAMGVFLAGRHSKPTVSDLDDPPVDNTIHPWGDEDAPLLEPSAVELVPKAATPSVPHVSEPSLHSRSPSPAPGHPQSAPQPATPHCGASERIGVGGQVAWWRYSEVARLWRQQRPLYRAVWAHVHRLAWSMLVLYATTLAMWPGVQLQVCCYRLPVDQLFVLLLVLQVQAPSLGSWYSVLVVGVFAVGDTVGKWLPTLPGMLPRTPQRSTWAVIVRAVVAVVVFAVALAAGSAGTTSCVLFVGGVVVMRGPPLQCVCCWRRWGLRSATAI